MKTRFFDYRQGWAVWLLAFLLIFMLPGTVWRPAPAPAIPWSALLMAFAMLAPLVLATPLLAARLGPEGARQRLLALLEAPPDFLWGGFVLAAWPAAWGPPAAVAFTAAFLAAALPTEARWLCASLPSESPFPAAYGSSAVLQARRCAILHLFPRWLAVRLPLWLTAALVLERIFGVQGLGSDWNLRITTRDHYGLVLWVLAFALIWRATRAFERP